MRDVGAPRDLGDVAVAHVGNEQSCGHGPDVDGGDPPVRLIGAPRLPPRARARHSGRRRIRAAHPMSSSAPIGSSSPRSANATCTCRHFTPRGSRCPPIPTVGHASTPPDSSARSTRTRASTALRESANDAISLGALGEPRRRAAGLLRSDLVYQMRAREPRERGKRRAVVEARRRDDHGGTSKATAGGHSPGRSRCATDLLGDEGGIRDRQLDGRLGLAH